MKNLVSIIMVVAVFLLGCSETQFAVAPEETQTSADNQAQAIEQVEKSLNYTVPEPGKRQVDILVVVDNSVSMQEEQAAMAARFSGFIDQLDELDWRLAIITTQNTSDAYSVKNCEAPGRDGCLMPFATDAPWIDSRMSPQVADYLFRSTVQMPADSTYVDERAIYSANRFLQRYQAGDHEFFRPNSHVSLIIVSDEDERSGGRDPRNKLKMEAMDEPLLLIENYFKGLRPASFVANGIITKPGDEQCWLNGNGRWPGNVYKELIDATGGVEGSVCASDYGAQLNEIGQVIQRSVTSINLDCQPADEPTITLESTGESLISLGVDFEVIDSRVILDNPLEPGEQLKINYLCAQ